MIPAKNARVLVVDDEPDVHAVTKLSLKTIRHRGESLDVATASSAKEAIAALRDRPDTAVVLLDVVMESQTAGLDACKAIRGELGNKLVRILLRTGQPGVAPEKKAIDDYDIDGYLPKAELTSNRLYAAIRTALKAFDELVALDRHRSVLASLHRSVAALHAFEPLEVTLGRILETAVGLVPAPLALLELETLGADGSSRRLSLVLPREADAAAARAAIVGRRAEGTLAAGKLGEGYYVPITVHRDLGHGFLYLGAMPDSLAEEALPLLAAHAANALYASVARANLEARQGPFYDSLTV